MMLGLLAIVALAGAATTLLWNALLPSLLGVPTISFFQALGLLLLTRILFGFGFGRHHGPGFGPMGRRRHELRERWRQMTPEERAHFMKHRRGFWMDEDEIESTEPKAKE